MAKKKEPPIELTSAERMERIRFCYDKLMDQCRQRDVRFEFLKHFTNELHGPPKVQEIDAFIKLAKAAIKEEEEEEIEVRRAQSAHTYRKIIQSPDNKPEVVISAQTRMDKLYGLEAPTKVAPTNPAGDKPYDQLSDAELDARILAALTARAED